MTELRQHAAQSTAEPPEDWPAGVYPISMGGMSHLGVGNDGAIYWDGKPIEVRRTLTTWQRVGAVTVTASAVIAAVSAAVSAYADLAALPS
ncbi:hypothetical protein [Sphingomonas sp. Leaf37]|uniref:hypothetical protein n=1 Tax=Sphingomonas sp. Leaf37 TaxID=2876552 RepID=UPI001E2DF431|nr:hypothetical protein [Sphingomonas sp. Leaf37]